MTNKEKQQWIKKLRLLEKAYYKGKNDVSEKEFYEWVKALKPNLKFMCTCTEDKPCSHEKEAKTK